MLKVRDWHRFTSQFTYTYAHGLDDMTAYRGTLPQDSFFLKGDYGSMDFDTRHTFTATLNYDLPNANRLRPLLNGWTLSSLVSLHTGQPFTVFSSNDTSGTEEGEQRANLIGDPYAGVSHAFSKSGVTWINPAAFADPAAGTFGNSGRNAFYGPGYASVDFSVVKNTKITERIGSQFRVEILQPLQPHQSCSAKRHQRQRPRYHRRHHRRLQRRPRHRPRRSLQPATRVEDYFLAFTINPNLSRTRDAA